MVAATGLCQAARCHNHPGPARHRDAFYYAKKRPELFEKVGRLVNEGV